LPGERSGTELNVFIDGASVKQVLLHPAKGARGVPSRALLGGLFTRSLDVLPEARYDYSEIHNLFIFR
jgi:hypothetical protein